MTTEAKFRASVLPFTLRREGGFSVDRLDPGNWTGGKVGTGVLKGTKFGIAASAHPLLDIAGLTLAQASDIYWREYVLAPGFERLAAPLLLVVFDAGVNCGPGRAAGWLKVASNKVGLSAQIAAVTALNLAYHRSLSTWSHYGQGWAARIAACQLQALKLAAPPQPATGSAFPPPRLVSLPPSAMTAQPKVRAMKKTPALLALLLVLLGVSTAQAADVDFAPLVSAGVEYFAVPLLTAGAAWLAGVVGMASKRYLDQKTSSVFAANVDAVLQKAISYGATQAEAYIGDKNLHTNVNGWIASYAADYAVAHAPELMKQAGDITQKITARLSDHAGVAALKAQIGDGAAATAPTPVAQAA